MNKWLTSAFSLIVLVLYGCGGGGSSSAPPPPANQPPTVDAGPDQSVEEGAVAQVSAAGSDPEGATLSYLWTQVSGPTVAFSSTDQSDTDFVVPTIGIGPGEDIVLEVQVTDDQGATASDRLTVTGQSTDFLLFPAYRDDPDKLELYKVDAQTKAISKISPSFAQRGQAINVSLSPNGQYVAFMADAEALRDFNLFVVDVRTESSTQVSNVTSGLQVGEFVWSPDSTSLAYSISDRSVGVNDIYIVDADGANNRQVSLARPAGALVNRRNLVWSPDGRYVSYVRRTIPIPQSNEALLVHDVQAGGQNETQINPALIAGGSIGTYAWSSDGAILAYTASQQSVTELALYSALPDGSQVTRLAGNRVLDFAWSPTALTILYYSEDIPELLQLYTAAADGSSNTLINPPLATTGRLIAEIGRWSPDGSKILYRGDVFSVGFGELFVVDPDGNNNTRVSEEYTRAPPAGVERFYDWSPDGARIAYISAGFNDSRPRLLTVRPDATERLRLSAANARAFRWSTDSTKLAYISDQEVDRVFELFAVNPDASENIKVSGPLVLSGDVVIDEFEWSADLSRIAYLADQETDGQIELFIGSPDGSGSEKVSGTLPAGEDILQFFWSR